VVKHRLTSVFANATLSLGVVSLLALAPTAQAQQQGQDWFVPGQARPGAGAAAPRPAPRPTTPARPPGAQSLTQDALAPQDEQIPQQQIQVQLPPAPEVPELPKGNPPPAAIVGILSIPDVLRVSTAYQAADRELGMRRQKLNEDAQKEQVALRDLGQAFANERAKLPPDQIRAREREFQERANESRRKFADRNRIIQEAGQYVMAQFDRTLEQIAQAVAQSRGVNIVLNRPQILGTTADFDLTPQVAEVLNKIMPTVVIPPDGVSPVTIVPVAATPDAAAAPGAAAGNAAAGAAKPAAPKR